MTEPKQIIRSSRKTLALTIDEKGDLIVHAPKTMALFEIFNFIEKKSDWIENKINTVKGTLDKNQKIIAYEEIFFLGKRYKVTEKNAKEARKIIAVRYEITRNGYSAIRSVKIASDIS